MGSEMCIRDRSIMSEEKTVLLAHAQKSEENFNRIKERASEIMMKVNSKKTSYFVSLAITTLRSDHTSEVRMQKYRVAVS